MGCFSSVSVTSSPDTGYRSALIEFMRMRQHGGGVNYSPSRGASCVEVEEYGDSGIAEAITAPVDKAVFSDQEIENCAYLGWVSRAC
jgi:hypothetical protein